MSLPPLSTSEIYRLVGERIRLERKKRKLRQEDVALKIGLTRASVTNIEKGRQKLLLHTVVDISNALGIALNDMMAPLEPMVSSKIENALPQNLSPSIKNWIMSGVKTAKKKNKA